MIARSKTGAYLLFALVFFISACSSESDNKKQPASSAPVEKKYQVYTVEIKGMQFVPDTITVNKGDEVVFVNRDIVNHCVTEEKNHAWTSSALAPGASYLIVAKENTDYYCAIHQVMKGKIIVQ